MQNILANEGCFVLIKGIHHMFQHILYSPKHMVERVSIVSFWVFLSPKDKITWLHKEWMCPHYASSYQSHPLLLLASKDLTARVHILWENKKFLACTTSSSIFTNLSHPLGCFTFFSSTECRNKISSLLPFCPWNKNCLMPHKTKY